MERRIHIARENENLQIVVTHEGIIVDSTDPESGDVEELGGWTWDEMLHSES